MDLNESAPCFKSIILCLNRRMRNLHEYTNSYWGGAEQLLGASRPG